MTMERWKKYSESVWNRWKMKHYLKKKRELFAVATMCWCIFGLIGFLCSFPAAPVVYGIVLSAAILAGWTLLGYAGYRRHIRELEEMRQMAAEGLAVLPWAESCEEELYAQALSCVLQDMEETKRQQERELENARQYYALWSHQIKTPLAALRLLLQEEEPDRKAMEPELLKAEQYVEMALQYQRLSGGTGDLVLQEYELDRIVKQAVKKTAPLFIYQKLRLEIGEITGTVVTDEKWLTFVLEQILTNAAKYTKRGTVTIRQEDRTLIISDTGIGILAEDLPRVFEWGYTGFNGRMNKHSTGIGLSLCKQMMNRLDHRIWLESEPGAGTRVYLDLSRVQFQIE